MRLESAYLCECGEVGDSAKRCPKCANELGLLNLSSVLNRRPPLMAETQVIMKLQMIGERIA